MLSNRYEVVGRWQFQLYFFAHLAEKSPNVADNITIVGNTVQRSLDIVLLLACDKLILSLDDFKMIDS